MTLFQARQIDCDVVSMLYVPEGSVYAHPKKYSVQFIERVKQKTYETSLIIEINILCIIFELVLLYESLIK